MELIHASFYDNYVNSVSRPISFALLDQEKEISLFLSKLSSTQLNFKYSPEKWTLKEVLLHCLDVERIMATRCLMISRGEQNNLLGFDENAYVSNTHSDFIQINHIQNDFKWLRNANISLLNMLPEQSLNAIGSADQKPISVASLWHIIVGHWNHHIDIINKRYLKS